MSPGYRKIEAEILVIVEPIRAARPETAEYFEKHFVFDHEREAFMYTGHHRIKMRRVEQA